jgi:hypothetical protein
MTAEQIVRALTAADAPVDAERAECLLCGMAFRHLRPGPQLAWDEADGNDPADHKPGCPWRLAREWVEQHPKT